jgi:hypothetical protein
MRWIYRHAQLTRQEPALSQKNNPTRKRPEEPRPVPAGTSAILTISKPRSTACRRSASRNRGGNHEAAELAMIRGQIGAAAADRNDIGVRG